MQLLRHSVLQRVLCLGLLAGLALSVAAPAAGATPQRAVTARVGSLPGPVTSALDAALAEVVRTPTPDGFAAAFASALAAQPGGADLASFLEAHPTPEALLALLYDHLLRAYGHYGELLAAPAGLAAFPAASSVALKGVRTPPTSIEADARAAACAEPGAVVVVPVAVYSAAQPLGP